MLSTVVGEYLSTVINVNICKKKKGGGCGMCAKSLILHLMRKYCVCIENSCSYIVSVTYLWDDLELRTKWNKLETEGIKRVSIPENIYSLGGKTV